MLYKIHGNKNYSLSFFYENFKLLLLHQIKFLSFIAQAWIFESMVSANQH